MGKHYIDPESGEVRLNWRVIALLVTILISSLGGFGFVVRLGAEVSAMKQTVDSNAVVLHEHVTSDGHRVALERTDNLKLRVDKVEAKLDKPQRRENQ